MKVSVMLVFDVDDEIIIGSEHTILSKLRGLVSHGLLKWVKKQDGLTLVASAVVDDEKSVIEIIPTSPLLDAETGMMS